MTNEIITTVPADLSQYNNAANLIDIRRHADLFPRVGTFTLPEITARLEPFVYGAFLYRGQETNPTTLRFIASALASEIMADRKWGMRQITFNEIGYAIRNAVLGESTLYGVSVASLYNAILDYLRGEGHDADKKARQ